jgi:hypothetical protein
MTAFGNFADIVLVTQDGSRVLWTPEQAKWRPATSWGVGFVPYRDDGDYGTTVYEPYDDDIAAIEKVIDDFRCLRCGRPQDQHLIAPNVLGDATVYCVQKPTIVVARSSPGQNRFLHSGLARIACPALSRPGRASSSEIRDWDWCFRCVTKAELLASDVGRDRFRDTLAQADRRDDFRVEFE